VLTPPQTPSAHTWPERLRQETKAVEHRLVEALTVGRRRHSNVRRHYERVNRLDVVAARAKLDRHHSSETDQT
jgi:hypothetical protein